tara:strand:+ start:3398 stop:3649 length:252 start_codon:yes stop_codon:yes gene_type:complete
VLSVGLKVNTEVGAGVLSGWTFEIALTLFTYLARLTSVATSPTVLELCLGVNTLSITLGLSDRALELALAIFTRFSWITYVAT